MSQDGVPAGVFGISPRSVVPHQTLASILDSIPCGVVVLDRDRRIRAVNHAFRRALQITDAQCLGRCQGSVLGCLHAAEEDHHERLAAVCEDCELAALVARTFAAEQRVHGRATLQLATDGRLRDVTLECSTVPVTISSEELVVVLLEGVREPEGAGPERPADGTFGMIGRDPAMEELFDVIRQVAPLRVPVLIHGETGTGKELVARALHRNSPRSDRLMVTLNCGAVPDGLLESELFGHVKGSFTGAHRDKKGRFELADRGTIFLDEIGELSPAMQVRFLRVLQDGSFEPVGSESTVRVDARVVCATNRNLENEVAEGRFRADLYYRLAVVPIRVPPLRERADDVPLLVQHFLNRIARESPALRTSVVDRTLETLMSYHWPGNVRELENAVRFAAIRAKGDPITCSHLPPSLDQRCGERPVARRRPRRTLDPRAVEQALLEAGGNRSRAAERLGVSRTTLWRFLRKDPADGPSG